MGDHTLVSVRLFSTFILGLAAWFLRFRNDAPLRLSPAWLCPLAMAVYGLGQTLLSNQKIIFNGLDKSLFWLTAAAIALLSAQLFQSRHVAEQFRCAVALFGTGEALLSVLEQGWHTTKYFWIFPSGYSDVFGSFGYYNNFAQVIELTLPVTLYEALRGRSVQWLYLVGSAIQVGAVIASSSRAGAVLVSAELLAVLFLAWYWQRRSLSPRTLMLALTLSCAFTFATGYQHVVQKLQRPDQLSSRRLINEASLHMIESRPLSGWGLGAYVPVYKMFALYDDGTWVNQAHNDYLEWAAEGGIPYACILLVLIGWSLLPAVRSVWGLGLIAFCLHAAVDYPFARLGTCGWYFALAAMLMVQCGSGFERKERRRREKTEQIANSTTLA
jgi:O-antigen ligase